MGNINWKHDDRLDALVRILNDNYNDIVYYYNYDIADWFKCAKRLGRLERYQIIVS